MERVRAAMNGVESESYGARPRQAIGEGEVRTRQPYTTEVRREKVMVRQTRNEHSLQDVAKDYRHSESMEDARVRGGHVRYSEGLGFSLDCFASKSVR